MVLPRDRILTVVFILLLLGAWRADAATLEVDKGGLGAILSGAGSECDAGTSADATAQDKSSRCGNAEKKSVLDTGSGTPLLDQAMQQQWDDGFSNAAPTMSMGQMPTPARESTSSASLRKGDLADAIRAEYLASTEEPKLRATLKESYRSLKDLETSAFGTQSSARDPSFALERATVPGGSSARGGGDQPNLIRDLRDRIIDFIDDNPIISVLLAIVGLFGLGFALRT